MCIKFLTACEWLITNNFWLLLLCLCHFLFLVFLLGLLLMFSLLFNFFDFLTDVLTLFRCVWFKIVQIHVVFLFIKLTLFLVEHYSWTTLAWELLSNITIWKLIHLVKTPIRAVIAVFGCVITLLIRTPKQIGSRAYLQKVILRPWWIVYVCKLGARKWASLVLL